MVNDGHIFRPVPDGGVSLLKENLSVGLNFMFITQFILNFLYYSILIILIAFLCRPTHIISDEGRIKHISDYQ